MTWGAGAMIRNSMIARVTLAAAGLWIAGGMASAYAARPTGGDTKAPGQVTSVTPLAAERGVALGFLATGDDGSSGQATQYQTQIWPGSPCGSPPTALTEWTLRSIVPRVAGGFDAIGWADLDPATDYCVRFRVVDEAGNATVQGPFAVRTTDNAGNWAFTGIKRDDLPNPAVASVVTDDQTGDALVVAFGAPGVRVARLAPGFVAEAASTVATTISSVDCSTASGCLARAETDVELAGYSGIDWQFPSSMGVVGIPGDGLVGVIMRGSRADNGVKVPLFAELTTAGWSVEALPFDPSKANQGSVGLIYINDRAITTWVEETSSSATLHVAERIGAGNWNSTRLITRSKSRKTAPLPGFGSRSLIETNGRLGIWVSIAPDGAGGVANGIYLVRCAANDAECRDSNGTQHAWIWYDTGRPAGVDAASTGWFSQSDLAAIGPDGKLRVVDRVASAPGTVQTLHQNDFGPPSYGLPGTGATSGTTRPWQTLLAVPAVSGYSPPVRLTGMTFSGCGYHVGYTLGYGTLFQQQSVLHVRAGDAAPVVEPVTFSDVTVDLTDKRLALATDGDLIYAMRSIRAERDELTLARRSFELCPAGQ